MDIGGMFMFDTDKRYGITTEELFERGRMYPDDNFIMCDGYPDQILSIKDIFRMFPEQVLVLCNVTYGKNKYGKCIKSAAVYKYHCHDIDALRIVNKAPRGKYERFDTISGWAINAGL